MNIQTFKPNYFFKRVRQWKFEKMNPGVPWLNENAILLLDNWLKKTDSGFEWGSGRSTRWFLKKTNRISSIENNLFWYNKVNNELKLEAPQAKYSFKHIECDLGDYVIPTSHPYADEILKYKDGAFDYVLVDGSIRFACIKNAIKKIKPGGLLILDNAERFVQNTGLHGVTSVRNQRSKAVDEKWVKLMEKLEKWRWINTSNGIWDTRFWIRP